MAFTAWEGHAFLYTNACVFQYDAERLPPRFRSEPGAQVRQLAQWNGELRAGHFWARDLRAVVPEGHAGSAQEGHGSVNRQSVASGLHGESCPCCCCVNDEDRVLHLKALWRGSGPSDERRTTTRCFSDS